MPAGLFPTNVNTGIIWGKFVLGKYNLQCTTKHNTSKLESGYMSFLLRRWVLELGYLYYFKGPSKDMASLCHRYSLEVIWAISHLWSWLWELGEPLDEWVI